MKILKLEKNTRKKIVKKHRSPSSRVRGSPIKNPNISFKEITFKERYMQMKMSIWTLSLPYAIHMPGGGVLPMWWVIHMCRGFDPLFSLWQDRARSFWGVFSHPPTQKGSFGYKSSQNSIFLAPKYHFSLDLFGSNFQWPAAHPQQFSDRVPPPGTYVSIQTIKGNRLTVKKIYMNCVIAYENINHFTFLVIKCTKHFWI